MICSVCGNNYDDNVAFCPTCGAVNNSAAAPADEPTIGSIDSLPPVMPQPVEAPVAEQQTAGAPVVTPAETDIPVAPQPEAVDTMAQADFVASVPQADIVAPVVAQPVAPAPAKKSKKSIIIGAVAALIVAIIVAVVLIFVLPGSDKEEGDAKKAEGDAQTQSATYEVDSPLGDISAALEKTLFENSGMSIVVRSNGQKMLSGGIGIGDNGEESGFYLVDNEGYGYGFAEYVMYDSWGGEDPMPDEFVELMNERFSLLGLDIEFEQALDDVFNNKIDRDALKQIYNDNLSAIEDMIYEEVGISVTLPEFDEIQEVFAGCVNDGLTDDAISITETMDGDDVVYELDINIAELLTCLYEYAKEESKLEGIVTLLGLMLGSDGSDPFELIEQVLDYYIDELDVDVSAEIVVNKDGYITEIEIDAFGEAVSVEFGDFNNVEVTLDTLKDNIDQDEYYEDYYEDDYYYDDYYEDDYYDDYYVDDYYDDYYEDDYYDDYYYDDEEYYDYY